jgi:hypothetical protein
MLVPWRVELWRETELSGSYGIVVASSVESVEEELA